MIYSCIAINILNIEESNEVVFQVFNCNAEFRLSTRKCEDKMKILENIIFFGQQCILVNCIHLLSFKRLTLEKLRF